jgi:hypothetical protein
MLDDEFAQARCLGKEPFADRQLARRVAARKPGRIAYKCGECGFWHVGHRVKRRRFRRRAMSGGREYLRY